MNDILLPPRPADARLVWRLRPNREVAITVSHGAARTDAILTARQRVLVARRAVQGASGRSARRSAASWAGSGARP